MHEYLKVYDIFLERKVPIRLMRTLGPKKFVEQYSCLKINLGRGTGKTTFIKRVAGVNDLVIVPSSNSQYRSGFNDGVVVYDGSSHNKSSVLRGVEFNNIFVDEPSLISDLDDILNNIAWDCKQNLIMVG